MVPELPEVEGWRRYLDATSLHRRVQQLEVRDTDILENVTEPVLKARIEGQTFKETRRHGKYLFVQVDKQTWLVMHFGMTGFLKYFRGLEEDTPHDRLLFTFRSGHHLAYDCQRKFGAIAMAESASDFVAAKGLGPDALEVDLENFHRLLDHDASIKSVLMNQEVIAGIGNVYSDEILYRARLHPEAKARGLSSPSVQRLYEGLRDVLEAAVDHVSRGTPLPDTWLVAHRETGASCPGCQGKVEHVEVSGRSSYFCPACQKL